MVIGDGSVATRTKSTTGTDDLRGNFGHILAHGAGWRALEVVCTAGPNDRPFEERHAWSSISLVMAGTFAYRSDRGTALMSPGAMVLGTFGKSFECSHEHGIGDRCLSFQFTRDSFEAIASDAGARRAGFAHDRMPPLRELALLSARAVNAIAKSLPLDEIALELAGAVLRVDAAGMPSSHSTTTRDRMRIGEVLRHLELHPDEPHTLTELAGLARLSPYHFLRTFKIVTGLTPHQWVIRARLRDAARRLAAGRESITEIALEAGFQDLANFIRSFHAQFGVSPRRYRALS